MQEEDHSCSSGSSSVSEDMSFSDSGDSVEVPEFMDATEHKSEKLSAAVNEVVTGIQHTFYTPEMVRKLVEECNEFFASEAGSSIFPSVFVRI
jgi:hypothetical protein